MTKRTKEEEVKLKQIVANLVKLQTIDTRLDELKLQKGDLPFLIEQTQEDLDEKQGRLEALQKQKQKIISDRRMFELEVEASKEQLKKFEEQLYQVKTNKEYDAISLEIDTKKLEIEELDNKILQTLESEEELDKEIAELTAEIQKLQKQLNEYQQELEEISQQTQSEEERLKVEREEVVAQIEPRLYRQYERIRSAKGGIAVASVKRSSCGGCYSAIPPQKIVEIRELNRLITCEFCGRILVWMNEE